MTRAFPPTQRGLTLLELLVAFVIMAFSLGALYRASGNAVRGVATTEHHVRAASLARSLLQAHDAVPATGWQETGETAGFSYRVETTPYPTAVRSDKAPLLHQVQVVVGWNADGQARQLEVRTLLPQSSAPTKEAR